MIIQRLKETDSTNRYLMQQAARAAYDDDIVVAVAANQTAGRGMGSNTWESEAGKNLLFSILIHPTTIPPRWQYLLSMTEALAVREAVAGEMCDAGMASEADAVTIKWPNDIYWRDKKVSGTRIDLNLEGAKIRDMVIGTGINVNQMVFLSDAPNPVSLAQIAGKEFSVERLLDRIIGCFQRYYGQLLDGGHQEIVQMYHQYLYRSNGFHRYEDAEGVFEAEVIEVMPDGIIHLRRRDGSRSAYEFKTLKFIIM